MQEKNWHSMFQDILVLLCFNDKAAPILAHSLKLDYFGDPCYRDIASKAIEYFLQYKTTPGKAIYELLGDVINGKDLKKSERYVQTISHIYSNAEAVKEKYVLDQLDEFISRQSLELFIHKGAQLYDEGQVEEAWTLFRTAQKQRTSLFDLGIRITDVEEALKLIGNNELYVDTGIPELNKLGICPTPGELMVLTALSGKGKTWMAGHLVKYAFLDRKTDGSRHKICHISLEMSRGRTIQRYYQSLFAISKDITDSKKLIYFEDNTKEEGRIKTLDVTREVFPKMTFKDIDIEEKLRSRVSGLRCDNLIMKDYPPGKLSIDELYAYLDGLENFHDFKPDILVVDYPELMYLPGSELRIAIGNAYKALKGLADEKGIAVIAPCQVNRAGDGAQLITRKFMAEDYSKIHTCDVHITYNQTEEEHKKGLARLYVDKNRNGESNDIILISQDYAIGQFCVSSTMFDGDYSPATAEIIPNSD